MSSISKFLKDYYGALARRAWNGFTPEISSSYFWGAVFGAGIASNPYLTIQSIALFLFLVLVVVPLLGIGWQAIMAVVDVARGRAG